MANDTIYQIQQQLNVLKKSTQECGIEIEKTRQMQEHHSINFYKHHQISGIYFESNDDDDFFFVNLFVNLENLLCGCRFKCAEYRVSLTYVKAGR